MGMDSGINMGIDIGTGMDSGIDMGIDIGMHMDSGIDMGIDVGMDMDSGIDMGIDIGMDIDSGIDMGIDIGMDMDSGIDMGIDIGMGIRQNRHRPDFLVPPQGKSVSLYSAHFKDECFNRPRLSLEGMEHLKFSQRLIPGSVPTEDKEQDNSQEQQVSAREQRHVSKIKMN